MRSMSGRKQYQWQIRNIHTNERFPGNIYAEVYDGGKMICAATLQYCCGRITSMIMEESKIADTKEAKG